jgi:hypothetical protein
LRLVAVLLGCDVRNWELATGNTGNWLRGDHGAICVGVPRSCPPPPLRCSCPTAPCGPAGRWSARRPPWLLALARCSAGCVLGSRSAVRKPTAAAALWLCVCVCRQQAAGSRQRPGTRNQKNQEPGKPTTPPHGCKLPACWLSEQMQQLAAAFPFRDSGSAPANRQRRVWNYNLRHFATPPPPGWQWRGGGGGACLCLGLGRRAQTPEPPGAPARPAPPAPLLPLWKPESSRAAWSQARQLAGLEGSPALQAAARRAEIQTSPQLRQCVPPGVSR